MTNKQSTLERTISFAQIKQPTLGEKFSFFPEACSSKITTAMSAFRQNPQVWTEQ